MGMALPRGASNLPLPGEEPKNVFEDVLSVGAGTPMDVVSYTVPPGKEFFLDLVEGNSDAAGTLFEFFVGADKAAEKFNYWTRFSVEMFFNKNKYLAGTVLKLRATHQRPFAANFSGRIVGVLR